MDYEDYIETNTTGRCDVSPLFANPSVFAELCSDLLSQVTGDPTVVCGIESLGFVLGSAVSTHLGVGFVPIRKGGKLPYPSSELVYRECRDYSESEKTLELYRDAISTSDRVVVVDEWIETGSQMQAAVELIEETGGSVEGIMTIVAEGDVSSEVFDGYDVYSGV